MKKYLFTLNLILFCLLFVVFLSSCEDKPTPPVEVCEHSECSWVWEEDARCNQNNMKYYICDKCGKIIDSKEEFKVSFKTCSIVGSILFSFKYVFLLYQKFNNYKSKVNATFFSISSSFIPIPMYCSLDISNSLKPHEINN